MKFYLHKYGRLFHWFFPYYQWKVPTSKKEIYLTFDDGPVPEVTEFVLDELAKYNAKATFFCVGENIEKYPFVFKRLLQEGHTVGNHTYNHLNARKTVFNTFFNNVYECEKRIGNDRKLFRPPYARLPFKYMRKLKALGYKIIMWDVLTGDFDPKIDTHKALEKSLAATSCGSIVLMHDNPKHFPNLKQILPKYLTHFNQLGYTFKSL